jgi:hypothetical protein
VSIVWWVLFLTSASLSAPAVVPWRIIETSTLKSVFVFYSFFVLLTISPSFPPDPTVSVSVSFGPVLFPSLSLLLNPLIPFDLRSFWYPYQVLVAESVHSLPNPSIWAVPQGFFSFASRDCIKSLLTRVLPCIGFTFNKPDSFCTVLYQKINRRVSRLHKSLFYRHFAVYRIHFWIARTSVLYILLYISARLYSIWYCASVHYTGSIVTSLGCAISY